MRNSEPDPSRLAADLTKAAHAAGKVLLRWYGKKYPIREKKGAGLVTPADLAAEEAALKILQAARPDFGLLTEETSPFARASATSEGRWVVDPLDGTTNYVHGFPMFCVSAAAEWRGRVIAGVIYHPVLGDTYVATRGRGARLNGKPIRASRTARMRDALLTTGFAYRKDAWLHAEMEAFERLSAVARAIRRPGSAALDLAYVARGVFDGFWETRLSPWDVAAGALMVEEAGGRVTDFGGRPFRVESPEILASNSRLHSHLRREIAGSV